MSYQEAQLCMQGLIPATTFYDAQQIDSLLLRNTQNRMYNPVLAQSQVRDSFERTVLDAGKVREIKAKNKKKFWTFAITGTTLITLFNLNNILKCIRK